MINQDHHYEMALLSRNNPSMDSGIAAIERVAVAVNRVLNSADQRPVGCRMRLPKSVPTTGRRILLPRACGTNSGQKVRVRTAFVPARDNSGRRPKLVRSAASGKVVLRTRGASGQLRITYSAPGSVAYAPLIEKRVHRV